MLLGANSTPQLVVLKELFVGKPQALAPSVKRDAIATMVIEYQLSERHACTLVGLSRDSYRNPVLPSELNTALSTQITEIAHTRRRAGYRMIHDLLRSEHPGINHKRIYRLYSEAGLAVRSKVKAERYGERVPLVQAETVNQTWSLDFVSDSLSTGRRLKFLTVADDFTRECVQMAVDFGMGASYVTRLLDEAAQFRGYPQAVRTDHGPEFIAKAFLAWTQSHQITHILIQTGCPTQSAYIESFNGSFRDECLNEHWFTSLAEARAESTRWRRDYNEVRPHSSIGRIPPAKFAAQHRQLTADAAREASSTTHSKPETIS